LKLFIQTKKKYIYIPSTGSEIGSIGVFDDYFQVSIVGGIFISIKNKFTTDLPISMYSIDGQSITSEIILSPLSSTDIDISRWPNGVYILKSQILGNQVAKKLVNVR